MRLRSAVLLAALVAVPALGACGGDDATSASTTLLTGDTQPVGDGGYTYATGPDDVVLSLRYDGGFVPVGFAFSNQPNLLITGDGRVFTPGAQTLQYPGPMISPTNVQTISPAGIQALLALAADNGLLAPPPVYATNDMIADAPFTIVDLSVDGVTYEHAAYALGLTPDEQPETDPARLRLATFVDAISDLSAPVPEGSTSQPEPFVASAYEIRSMPVDQAAVEGAVVTPWASDTRLTLAAASECLVVPAADATATGLLTAGTQSTVFTDAGVSYQVFVRPQLPGGPAC